MNSNLKETLLQNKNKIENIIHNTGLHAKSIYEKTSFKGNLPNMIDLLKEIKDSSFLPKQMNCSDCINEQERYYAIIKIFLIFLIFVFAVLIVCANNGGGTQVQDFIRKNRCNPVFMPFISIFLPGENNTDNFNKCIFEKGKTYFNIVAMPLKELTNEVVEGSTLMGKRLDTLNKSNDFMIKNMIKGIDTTYSKLEHAQTITVYILLKTKAIFDKIGAFVLNIYYVLITLFDFTKIILLIPQLVMKAVTTMFTLLVINTVLTTVAFVLAVVLTVASFGMGIGLAIAAGTAMIISATFTGLFGAVSIPLNNLYKQADNHSYCCFPANTKISMDNNEEKFIQNIHLNDKMPNNTKVKGILEIISNCDDWYIYNNTIVAGNHYIYENDKWIRVFESSYSMKINEIHHKRYCLVTDKHFIYTPDGNIFSDFQETNNPPLLTEIAKSVLYNLNNKKQNNLNFHYEKGESGKGYNNVFIRKGNQKININDIQLGDQLDHENYVIGKYECCIENTFGVIVNEEWLPLHSIVYKNNKWDKVYLTYTDNEIVENPSSIGYNLITTKGTFNIVCENGEELIVRDLVEYKSILI